jgi:hypothetical protein
MESNKAKALAIKKQKHTPFTLSKRRINQITPAKPDKEYHDMTTTEKIAFRRKQIAVLKASSKTHGVTNIEEATKVKKLTVDWYMLLRRVLPDLLSDSKRRYGTKAPKSLTHLLSMFRLEPEDVKWDEAAESFYL